MGFEVNVPDDLYNQFMKVANDDELCEILEEVAPELQKSMQNSIKRVVKHEGESEVVNSVKADKPKKMKTSGFYCFVGPSGETEVKTVKGKKVKRKLIRNIDKAIYLNYGTNKQTARPWLEKAINDAEGIISKKLQEEFERRLDQ